MASESASRATSLAVVPLAAGNSFVYAATGKDSRVMADGLELFLPF